MNLPKYRDGWSISKMFTFEAAHQLKHLPANHPCSRVHGHSYVVIVKCADTQLASEGWLTDFKDLSAAVDPLIQSLDHQNLNDILPVVTTAENLAKWIFWQLYKQLPNLISVSVKETKKTIATYQPTIQHEPTATAPLVSY